MRRVLSETTTPNFTKFRWSLEDPNVIGNHHSIECVLLLIREMSTDLHQIWYSGRGCGRNHLCQFFTIGSGTSILWGVKNQSLLATPVWRL